MFFGVGSQFACHGVGGPGKIEGVIFACVCVCVSRGQAWLQLTDRNCDFPIASVCVCGCVRGCAKQGEAVHKQSPSNIRESVSDHPNLHNGQGETANDTMRGRGGPINNQHRDGANIECVNVIRAHVRVP